MRKDQFVETLRVFDRLKHLQLIFSINRKVLCQTRVPFFPCRKMFPKYFVTARNTHYISKEKKLTMKRKKHKGLKTCHFANLLTLSLSITDEAFSIVSSNHCKLSPAIHFITLHICETLIPSNDYPGKHFHVCVSLAIKKLCFTFQSFGAFSTFCFANKRHTL